MTPAGVEQMVSHGHSVLVEGGAGDGSGFSDEDYVRAGGKICSSAKEIYKKTK